MATGTCWEGPRVGLVGSVGCTCGVTGWLLWAMVGPVAAGPPSCWVYTVPVGSGCRAAKPSLMGTPSSTVLSGGVGWLAPLFGREVASGRTLEVEGNSGVGSRLVVTATPPSVYRAGARH